VAPGARHYGVDVVTVEERPGAVVRDIRIAAREDASADGPIEAEPPAFEGAEERGRFGATRATP
jgi:hypothetical protein